jgi:signal transduction histidine kinase
MKKYILLYVITGISLIAGFLLYAGLLKTRKQFEIDYVAINEITQAAVLAWQNPDSLGGISFTYRFVIINNEGDVRYASDENLPGNLTQAVRRGFLPMDIMADGSVIGKALIEALPVSTMEKAQKRLELIAIVTLILLCTVNIVFLSALHRRVVRPFMRLERFAHKISAGMFDEPLPMDKNNIFGLFTQSFDLMRESLLEARRNQTKEKKKKKELVASLSHDVKTPVTSIRLISELLQAGTTDPSAMEKLKTIEIKADQIDRLMNDLMQSALEELGELKVNLSTQESGILRELIESTGGFSKIKIAEIPDCLIELDAVRMEQVIGNVVSNSYKYAGTDIDVDFKVCGELLQIDINDYGKGVENETLELICTKFYRGENALALQKEGEGLGLYIAKLLMEKMGGGIETFNRTDGFTVRLLARLSH